MVLTHLEAHWFHLLTYLLTILFKAVVFVGFAIFRD